MEGRVRVMPSLVRYAILALLLAPMAAADEAFRLASDCPAGLVLAHDGTCRIEVFYTEPGFQPPAPYRGLYEALPPPRDGFTPQQIDLGRYLFFDPLLSADATTSCAHCHHPDHGWADGMGRGVGNGGRGAGPARRGGVLLARGTPPLWNVGFLRRLFWDGRARTLEEQAAGPMFAAQEMGTTPGRLEAALNGNAIYRALFAETFALEDGAPITTALVTRALAAFQGSLVSFDSRYDRFMRGDPDALDQRERRGYELFHSFATRCANCHSPPLFTNHELMAIGAPEAEGAPFDAGAGAGGDVTLHGAFRTPPLRNIARTAPYMHSGAHATLKEVVRFYFDPPGSALPHGERVLVHWLMPSAGVRLDDADVEALVAFLGALTDESRSPPVPARVPSGLPVVRTAGSAQRTAQGH